MRKRKVLNVRKYKIGYEVRTELIEPPESGSDDSFEMKAAYTADGHYIGSPKFARMLAVKYAILPELITPKHNVCSIGFSERDQKWYGWSHRAIFGFAVGDSVKEGDITASSGWTADYLKKHPEKDLSLPVGFSAKSLDDAKRMAVAFADAIA